MFFLATTIGSEDSTHGNGRMVSHGHGNGRMVSHGYGSGRMV